MALYMCGVLYIKGRYSPTVYLHVHVLHISPLPTSEDQLTTSETVWIGFFCDILASESKIHAFSDVSDSSKLNGMYNLDSKICCKCTCCTCVTRTTYINNVIRITINNVRNY